MFLTPPLVSAAVACHLDQCEKRLHDGQRAISALEKVFTSTPPLFPLPWEMPLVVASEEGPVGDDASSGATIPACGEEDIRGVVSRHKDAVKVL